MLTDSEEPAMTDKAVLFRWLRSLQGATYQSPSQARRNNENTDQLLNQIFEIGNQPLGFTDPEKVEAGTLFTGSIKPIQLLVERLGFKYRTCLDVTTLRKRSALQYLIDNYGPLPVGNGLLNDELKKANFEETVAILDRIIRDWRDESDSDEPKCYKTDPVDTSNIPSHHIWWTS